ncbi:hypothetical protein RJ640_005525 [Escallonia rubra]|uniref:Late embryogenesis abundant protein LEA-2 subgroup domain-containing protein n=1 Tax=Escallonia rubra TaxID=112253 RepID=A0AA88UBX0_9ASTE|nr:hypothetical protein RJ640_005525 [Escallonia rubra]
MIRRRISESRFAIYWWFFQVITVLSVVSVVIWLSLIPKCPTFTVTDLYVPALGSHSSTLEHDEVIRNTSVIINLEISNPNKRMGIYYDDIYVTLYYDDLVEGNGSIPGFSQGRERITSRKVLVNADHQQFWRETTVENTDIRVALDSAVRYRRFRWKTEHYQMAFEGNLRIDPHGNLTEKNIKLHKRH